MHQSIKNYEDIISSIKLKLEDQINKFEFDINSQNLIINQFLKLDHIIEAFFEKVIVNDTNERVKFNRLSLLNELSDNINKFSKFNLILV